MFIIQATYNDHTSTRDWKQLGRAQIEDILNQNQIKSRRIIPSKGFSFTTKHPKVVRTGFMAGKGNSTAAITNTYLGKAPYSLKTAPGLTRTPKVHTQTNALFNILNVQFVGERV